MELYSPQIEVTIGAYLFSKGLELTLQSCADTYYDWAKLQFVRPMEQKVHISRRDKAQIRIGYNGSLETVFTGYAVSDFTGGTNTNEILLKDGMLLLDDITVNNTFVSVTPQEVIRCCAELAGIERIELDTAPYQPAGCLPIFSQSGVKAIQSLGGYWGISPKFFFQDDTLFWGITAPQTKRYHFEHGKNIIRLERLDGCWQLTTVSVPFIKHSQTIQVTHPQVSGIFPVHRVQVTTKPQGFIRTTLFFKGDEIT